MLRKAIFTAVCLFQTLTVSASGMPETVTVGVQKTLDPVFFVETMGPTMAHLRKVFPEIRFRTVLLSAAELDSAVRQHEVDIFMADSGVFSYEEKKAGARDIAARTAPFAETPSRAASSAVIVRAGREDIRRIADLKGKSVAAVNEASFDGWLIVSSLISSLGYDEEKFWKKTVFTDYRDPNVAELVLSGEVDAGVLKACELESLEKQQPIYKDAFTVIGLQPSDGLACKRSAPLYPDIVLAAVPGLPAEFHKQLTLAVLTAPASFGGYRWGKADSFFGVDSLYKTLKLGPYAYLRELNWEAVREKYLPYVLGFIGLILLGVFYIFRVNRLVYLRTRQLQSALGAQVRLEKEARLSRQRLSQMERAGVVSQMSGMLAHEVLQPITALINFSGGLKMYVNRHFASDNTVTHACEVISEEAERISAIVDRVRSYAKTTDSPRETLLAGDIAEAAVRSFRHSTTAENTTVEIAEAGRNLSIYANKLEMELVIFNFLKNGASAMTESEEKMLTVSFSETSRGFVKISVRDRGPALSDEAFSKLSEPVISIKREGLGLGLSLCRAIVERHGGHLVFERNDSGLTASAVLPVAKQNPV